MCDSIEVDFLIDRPSETDSWPCKVSVTHDQNGQITGRWSTWTTVFSPLTESCFKVTAILKPSDTGKDIVTGYRVSVNVPACLIGNNAILTNDVPSAFEAAYRLLKHYLLNERVAANLIAKLSPERASMTSVTLTFLFRLGSLDGAMGANEKLHRRAHALLKKPEGSKSKAPVGVSGSGDSRTFYINSPRQGYVITSYVKSGPTSKSFNRFPSSALQDQVYQESAKLLRVEIKLNTSWLKKNKLDTLNAWQGVKEFTADKPDNPAWVNPYRCAFQLIRDALRLDEKFRERKPRPQDLAGLSDVQRSIVNAHIAGEDDKNQPQLKDKNRMHDWRLKKQILETLRIDLSIPWKVQRDALSPELADVLSWNNRRKIPRSLADVCFSRHLAKKTLAQLDVLLESRTKRSELTRLELIKKLAGPPAGHPTSQPSVRLIEPMRDSSASSNRAKRIQAMFSPKGTRPSDKL